MNSEEPVGVCPVCDDGLLYIEDNIEEIIIVSCNKCPYTEQLNIDILE